MNVKKILSVHKIMDAVAVTSDEGHFENPMDLEYEGFPDDNAPFGNSKYLFWGLYYSHLELMDEDANPYGYIWKVEGKNQIAYQKDVNALKRLLRNKNKLQDLVGYYRGVSIEDYKSDIKECIKNYDKLFDEKVAEVEANLNK